MNSFLFDKRVVRRNIEKGIITQQDYLAYLEGLENTEENCDLVEEKLYVSDEDGQVSDGEPAEETTPEH